MQLFRGMLLNCSFTPYVLFNFFAMLVIFLLDFSRFACLKKVTVLRSRSLLCMNQWEYPPFLVRDMVGTLFERAASESIQILTTRASSFAPFFCISFLVLLCRRCFLAFLKI